MTTSSPDDCSQPLPPAVPRSGRQAWLMCGMVGGGLLLFVFLVALVAWFVSNRWAAQDLAAQVAKVRARGEPLKAEELNEYYKPAAGRPDMTAEVTAAFALCDAKDLQALATDLPIVGKPPPPAPSQPWPQMEEVEAYLARHAAALETFHDLARRDGTTRFPVDFTRGIGAPMPQLGIRATRHGSRLLSLQLHVDLRRGRTTSAVDSVLAQLALVRAFDQEPMATAQFVRVALVASALADLQTAVHRVEIDDADLTRLQEGLRNCDELSSLKRALAGERAIGYITCFDPQIIAGFVRAPWQEEARKIIEGQEQRSRDAAKMLEFNLRISAAADESLQAARRESKKVDAELKKLEKGLASETLYMLTLMTTRSSNVSVGSLIRSAAKRACADAALGAERYRRRHDQWPATLEKLVPDFLPAVPLDPYSDRPVRLVMTPTELKAYSVGRDEEDNLGNPSVREEPQTDLGFVISTRRGDAP